jgi:hypothetical protein
MKCLFPASLVFELFFPFSVVFQRGYGGRLPNRDRDSPPMSMSNSEIRAASRSPCRCAEHLSRISDLDGRLSLLKRQAKTAMHQAGKSFGLMKQVSLLKDQVSDLMAKIIH